MAMEKVWRQINERLEAIEAELKEIKKAVSPAKNQEQAKKDTKK